MKFPKFLIHFPRIDSVAVSKKKEQMRLSITARGVKLDREWRTVLEERFRLNLRAWSSRIVRANIYIEDVNGPKGGLDRRCTIKALVAPSGNLTAIGIGINNENAVRSAASRLIRQLRDGFDRRRAVGRDSLWVRSLIRNLSCSQNGSDSL